MPEFETITAPADGEVTGAQLVPEITIDNKTGVSTKKQPVANWFATVRAVRSHPTIKLARILSISPALNSKWTVVVDEETAPEGARDLIYNMFEPQRSHILKSALFGMFDFGFAPFEKVWELEKSGLNSGALTIRKLKPLLVDNTKIRIDLATGAYAGLYQEAKNASGGVSKITLETPKTLCTSQNVEGTNWYGRGDIEDAQPFYARWASTDLNYTNYEKKFSGSVWSITYPIGVSRVNGVDKPNSTIASELLLALRSNGSISIPRTLRGPNGQGDLTANKIVTDNDWTIELIEPQSGASASMEARLKYLDVMMLRSVVMPERALTEGNHGTKADAEAHADAALTYAEDRHTTLLQAINWHCVNQVLTFNYGPEASGTVRLVQEPIGADDKLFLRDIYKTLLANQAGFALEADLIDTKSIKELLNIPQVEEDERVAVLRDKLDEGGDDVE